MTLTMAWVRAQKDVEELVVASDSRLRGGYAWDVAPKILSLPRSDCVLAFAGATDYAYPIMLQVVNAIACYRRARNRAMPLDELRGHLVRVINDMIRELSGEAEASMRTPDALFLLAGYSWRYETWRIWTLHYDKGIPSYTFRPATPWRGGHDRKMLAIVGDSVDVARQRLINMLREERHLTAGGFDWEPLRVLSSMITDRRFPSIGGPPQVVKVYKHLRVVPFAVPWWRHDGTPALSFMGRPLLEYESPDAVPMLPVDPRTGEPVTRPA